MDIQKLRLIIDSSAAKAGADEFKRSTDAVAAGATSATGSITKMESALDATARTARTSSDAIQRTAVTTEQARQAWEKSGGSMEKFAKELERVAGLQKQVTDSSIAMGRAHMQAIEMDQKLGQSFNSTGAGLGRLRMGMTALAAQLTGTNPLVDRAVATIGAMGTSTIAVLGALGAVIAGGIIWAAYTEQGRKAVAEQDKMTKSLEAWYAKEREGAAGDFPKQIEAETDKIKDLRKELDSFGKLGAVGEGGSKGLAWVRLWTDASAAILAGASGSTDAMRVFWQKMKDEIHDGAAHAQSEINTGFAAIHAANVKMHSDTQKQQADSLAGLIASNHATAAERAKAREILKTDIAELARLDRLAQTSAGGTKVDQAQRIALAEEVKKLTDALDPPKLIAAQDHLAAVKDTLARMQDEAKQFGSDASINTRTQAIIDDLDRLEKKFPKLTNEIEDMKVAAVDAGDALKQAADAKVSKEIDSAYNAQVALDKAMHDHNGTLRDLTASKRADMEIDRLVLALGHDLTNAEKDKIHFTYENAAALQDETEAAKRNAEQQKQALQKVASEQKHVLDEMQRETSRFFDDVYRKGFNSFADLFGIVKDLFGKMLADMEAQWVTKHLGSSVLGAFGVGSNGNSANPTLGAAGLGVIAAGGVVGYGVGHSMPNRAMGVLGGELSGAATGAMIGSVVPVLGTIAGAVIGAAVGMVGGLLGFSQKTKEEAAKLKSAREAFTKELQNFAYGVGDHSALESGLHALSQSLTDLEKKAKDLKLGTASLAEAERAAAAAQLKMKQDFLASIDSQIRDATGLDYISQAMDFQKAYAQNLKDIALAGGDTNKAAELFTKQIEKLGETLTADQLQQLLKDLPSLTNGMDPSVIAELSKVLGVDLTKALAAVATQAAEAADTLTRASEDLQIRFARASGSSVADGLARQFAQREELFQAQQNPSATPEYVAMLRLVQLYENAQATVQKQIADQTKLLQDQLNTEQATLATAQQTLQATQRVVDTLTQYRQSLLTGGLSTLSPEQQVQEAKRQVLDAFTKAMSGDKDAAGNFSQLSTSFLDLLQKNQASGPGYVSGFNSVTDMLDQLQQKYGAQLTIDQTAVDTAQKQVDLLQEQITKLSDVSAQETLIRQEVVRQLQAQQDDDAKAAAEAIAQLKVLQAQNDGQLAYAQTEVDRLGALYDDAVKSGDANRILLYNQWQEAIQLRDSALATRDKIAAQITATEKAADAAKGSSIDLIAAVNAGKSLNDLGQLALKSQLASQMLADQVHHNELLARLVAFQEAMVTQLKGGFHIEINDGHPSIPTVKPITLGGGSGGTDGGTGGGGTDGGVKQTLDDGFASIVAAVSAVRSETSKGNAAVADQMQTLADQFSQLVQITRFADRDSV